MKTNNLFQSQHNRDAFTLTELLVVLGMVAVLALVLTPALAATKPNSKITQCLNGKRQLTIAWQMYALDNGELLIDQARWISSFDSYMDWSTSPRNSDSYGLTNSAVALIASYNKSIAPFKCPADYYRSSAQAAANIIRSRSISINGVLGNGGSGPEVKGSAPDGGKFFGHSVGGVGFGRTCQKMSELSRPGPAATFVFLDEHPDSIDDGQFMFDVGISISSEYWRNMPASYHNGAAGISFADGHTEMHGWLEKGGTLPAQQARKTVYPVTFGAIIPWGSARTFSSSVDYAWMQAHMPYR